MSVLAQKNILVGVTGGIAAYKIPLLIRQLIKLNCNVKVVMTPSSKEFVTPLTLSTVSKNDVHSEFSTKKNGNPTWNNHVELSEWADVFIIAPATSNSISSMANAKCDNISNNLSPSEATIIASKGESIVNCLSNLLSILFFSFFGIV